MKEDKQSAASLSLRDKQFVEYYLINKDVVQAYRKAGYDPSGKASNVKTRATLKLQQPKLQEYLSQVQKEKKSVALYEITQNRIIEMLFEDREFAKECRSASAAISATKLLAQAIGMFKPQIEATTHTTITNTVTQDDLDVMKTLTKEEFDKLLAKHSGIRSA